MSMTTNVATSDGGAFGVAIGLVGLALPCLSFAWDGLVRRQILMPTSPIGSGGSFTIRRLGSIVIGLIAAASAVFLLLVAWGFTLVSVQYCGGSYSCLLGGVQWPIWIWFGICALWFSFVWLRVGDARKQTLVYGVWYHQEQTARHVRHALEAKGLPAVPAERLYALEGELVTFMFANGWLVHGKKWLDGGQERTSVEATPARMAAVALNQPQYHHISLSEQEAIGVLLAYFAARAESAKRMSPLKRWWVGTAQIGKGMTYGNRAIR